MRKLFLLAFVCLGVSAQVQLGRNVQIGGAGAGAGCSLDTPLHDGQLVYTIVGGCASSPNILVESATNSQTPSAATQGLVVNNVTNGLGDDHVNLRLNSAIDPSSNYSYFSPHVWKMQCSNSGTSQLGCSLNLFDDDNDASSATGGLQPIWIKMFATQPGDHPSYAGITMDESISVPTVTTAGMEGVQINGVADNSGTSSLGHVAGFVANMNAGTEFSLYEHAFRVTTPGTAAPPSGYCDFWAANQSGSQPRETFGCGPTKASQFYGPLTVQDLTINGTCVGCGGGSSGLWSGLLNPTSNLALTMGSYLSTFTYGAATGTADLFKLTDTASNTGTGTLFRSTTASGSTAIPWQADANGVGWKVATDGTLQGVGTSPYHGVTFPAANGLPAPTSAAGGIYSDISGFLYGYENGGALSRLCMAGNGLCASTSSGTPQYVAPQPIAGCGVEYVSGLTYTVGACTYTINGNTYTSALTNITLPAADPSNPKIDVIYVDSSGTVQYIQGTAAVTPQAPTVDPSTQLQLTFVLVPTAGTTPSNTTLTTIYDEGTEWTGAVGGTSSAFVNLTSTNNPYHGTKDTEFGAGGTVATTTYAQYVKPAAGTVDLGSYNSLIFYIRNKAAWASKRSVTIQWYSGSTAKGTAIVLSNGAYGFDALNNVSTYQQVSIPVSAFGIAGIPVTTVRFTVSGSSTNLTGFYLDQVTLQGGNGGVVLPSTLMNYKGAYSATATYQPNDVVVSGGVAYVALAQNTNVAVSTTATWTPLASGAGGTITGSGTANTMTKWTGTSAIGNSLATDDGTNWAYTGTGGVSAPAFIGTGTDHYLNLPSAPSHTGVAGDLYNNAGTLIWCPTGTCTNLFPLALTSLAAQAADTVVMNASGSSAAPTAVAAPSGGTNGCAGTSDASTYNNTTHAWGCHTISAGGSGSGLFGPVITTIPTGANTGFTTNWAQGTNFTQANNSIGLSMYDVNRGTLAPEGLVKAYPGSTFTATALFSLPMFGATGNSLGFVAIDTLSGKVMRFGLRSNGTVYQTQGESLSTPTTFNSSLISASGSFAGPYAWIRYKDDGTSIYVSLSNDGVFFHQIYTVTRSASYLGSSGFNFVGIFMDAEGLELGTTLMSYTQTSP